MDFGETVFAAAKREVKEETGLEIEELELISVYDERRYIKTDGKHYLGLGVRAKYQGGEIKIMEPHKCQEWRWYSLKNLPERMLDNNEGIINNFKAGKIY